MNTTHEHNSKSMLGLPRQPHGSLLLRFSYVLRYGLHSTAAVLQLEDLMEATEQTDGLVKYVAKHRVVGRAKIHRLLNPSALFELNAKQVKRKSSSFLS